MLKSPYTWLCYLYKSVFATTTSYNSVCTNRAKGLAPRYFGTFRTHRGIIEGFAGFTPFAIYRSTANSARFIIKFFHTSIIPHGEKQGKQKKKKKKR